MAKVTYKNGVASVILRVALEDTTSQTGGFKLGLTNSSAGLAIAVIADNEATTTAYSSAGGTIDTIATLGTFAAPGANHCRLKEVDSANHPGVYEIQIADARYAVAGARSLIVTVQATGAAPVHAEIQLSAADLNDGVHFGLTALPNAVAGASGGLLISGSNLGTTTLAALTVTGATTMTGGLVTNVTGNLSGSVGSVTGNVGGNVVGSVASVTAGVVVTTNNDKTGYALAGSEHTAIAVDAAAGLTAQGYTTTRAPKLDNLDAAISTRSTYTGADTAGTTTLLGRIPGTVAAQSGDSFARLGAPAGASIAADLASVKADTAAETNEQTAGTVSDPTPATSSFTGDASLSVLDDFYVGSVLVFRTGVLQGRARRVAAYTGSTRTLSFNTPWPAAPADGDAFGILGYIGS